MEIRNILELRPTYTGRTRPRMNLANSFPRERNPGSAPAPDPVIQNDLHGPSRLFRGPYLKNPRYGPESAYDILMLIWCSYAP
jgi:hypothetical protein